VRNGSKADIRDNGFWQRRLFGFPNRKQHLDLVAANSASREYHS